MLNINKFLIYLLRSFALVSIVTLGLLSILASVGGGGSSDDDPAPSFAHAGPDQSITMLLGAFLDGSGSDTPMGAIPEGDAPLYLWTVLSTPTVPEGFQGPFEGSPYLIVNIDSINPSLFTSIEGEYVVQLRVRFRGFSAWDTVSIFSSNSPPPIARAGFDQFVKHGTLVTLDASGSQAQREDRVISNRLPFKYSWFMSDKPAGSSSSLSTIDVVSPSFIAEYDPDDLRQAVRPYFSLYETQLQVINDDDLVSRPVHVKTYVFPSEGFVYPIPVVGPSQKVISGSTVELNGSASFDVDDRVLNYDWQFYARPPGSNATLTGADTDTPSFVADQDGVYVVQLQVSNEELSSIRYGPRDDNLRKRISLDYAGTDRVVITAQDQFTVPVANAGPDRILPFTGAEAIPLDGSGSYSPGGGDITYHWYLIQAPAGSNASIDTPDDTVPDSASLLVDNTSGSYVVGLSLNSPSIDFNNDHVVITLTENNSPTAAAGEDQAVSVGDTVMLNGSSSNDPDANPLGYSWSLASAPGPWGYENLDGYELATWEDWPALSNGMAAAPTFTPDLNGEYRLLLTVNDGEQSSEMDEVIIHASGSAANTAPTANAGVDQSVVVGDTVLLDGGDSSDPDSDPVTYTWSIQTQPLGSSAAIDDPSSETPGFVADVEGSYEVQLIVNDGLQNSNPDSMIVTAAISGACPTPLTLMTTLPFVPNVEMALNIQIDAQGADTLSVVTALTIVDEDVYRASIPDSNNLDQADFSIYGSNWEEISRSHANPVSDSSSPSFVVHNIADDIYYKLDIDFTGTANLNVQIDALSGCRCGSSAAGCPL